MSVWPVTALEDSSPHSTASVQDSTSKIGQLSQLSVCTQCVYLLFPLSQLSYDVSKDTLIKLLLAEARRCITQSTTQSSEDRDSSAPHDTASPELLQKRAGILELLKRTVFSTSGNEPSPNVC